jgi:SAM-dependent methyltransferase
MNSIFDIEKYTSGMKKSLLDKSFFLDKVKSNIFVDYGCADGTLIKFMNSIFPDYIYYGFDISSDMLSKAKDEASDNMFFTDRFEDILEDFSNSIWHSDNSKTLILSSIIHEIYSYGSSNDINLFWDRVFNLNFDYIVIRDMMLSENIELNSDINDEISVKRETNKSNLKDFELKWGL